jgi:hypothetical protein
MEPTRPAVANRVYERFEELARQHTPLLATLVLLLLKGASAYAINHMAGSDGQFKWQSGYGALSIGERSLETVKAYAAKQKDHHRDKTLMGVYERMDEEGDR